MPDPDKVAKCESKFVEQFAKLEAKGGCKTTGDAATIEAKVDAFLEDLDAELFACPPPSSISPAARVVRIRARIAMTRRHSDTVPPSRAPPNERIAVDWD